MVALARTIYGDTPDHDPAELLDHNRFPTPDVLRDHLFSAFLPAVYQQPPTDQLSHGRRDRHWDPHRAQHWLTYLAVHLTNLRTSDLAWWQLGNTLPRRTQVLAGALTYGLAYALVYGLIGGLALGLGYGLEFALAYGIAGVLGGGLAFGLARQVAKPAHTQSNPRGWPSKARKGLVVGLVVGLPLGIMFGVAMGIGYGLLRGIVYGIIFGIVSGLASGVGIVVRLGVPRDVKTAANPADLLASDRKNTVLQVLAIGIVTGALFALAFAFAFGVESVVAAGIAFGVGFGVVVGLGVNAWGWWLVLARIWLPLTGRLPWPVLAFLDDAYRRGVLRQAGAVYQFRHARLQDHLTRTFTARHNQHPANSR